VRIATFNILSGRSPADGRADLSRFHQAIRDLDADLLGLQEVDRDQPRSQHADLTAIAADAMGAAYHRFVPALCGTPGATWGPATGEEPADSPAYGIAFLSRYEVLGWRVVHLPQAPVPVPRRAAGRRRPTLVPDEPRVAVVAEVETPRGRIDLVTTHLTFVAPWNRHQLRRLRSALPPRGHPTVLLGDLNMPPRSAARTARMQPLASGATFPARAPRKQLDHILTTGGLGAARGNAVELAMSDHRALVADL
jgi:endonuclease/exonuclease/phosphatase family metal-dependent hydrolase